MIWYFAGYGWIDMLWCRLFHPKVYFEIEALKKKLEEVKE